ncbi:hypothetical protein F5144DRAFT_131729 [Chaetomium tenue]|uniref:Uncharacterized protein n=1 Tax=Chaetomium tenue TaxID=1854479 RepID=A0ACB7PK21_9PEZI|nr:hypothetical protein F5144DRAFT_131729 [Chaetomium globosum]
MGPADHLANHKPPEPSISATTGRIKGKAGAGLRRMPQSPEEWLESATLHGLAARTLADLCRRGGFSASTVPADSLLTMRPVWSPRRPPVDAAEAISQTQQFFTPLHFQQAQHILEHKLLGMDKLETLFDLICPLSPDEAPRTPKRIAGSLGDALGVFASLVSLYNRLMKQVAATPPLEETQPVMDAPLTKRFRDARLPGGGSPPSPLSDMLNLGRAVANLSLQTGKEPQEGVKRLASTTGHPNPRASQDLLEGSQSTIGGGSEREAAGPPLPSPRAPPETVVVVYLVNFLAAIAVQIQPFGRKPVCIADAFEQNFRFGPVPGPVPGPAPDSLLTSTAAHHEQEGKNLPEGPPSEEVGAGGRPLQPVASFLARVDGGIPCCKPQVDGELFVAFEVKRSYRGQDDVEIRAQETMEHCAIIWERHSRELPRNTSSVSSSQQHYHTLLISQNATEIYFSLSTYTNAYLDYLFSSSPDSTRVIPQTTPLDVIQLLKIEEFGPFYITDKKELRLVSQLVLALLLWQMEGFDASKLVVSALGRSAYDEDGEGGGEGGKGGGEGSRGSDGGEIE